MAALTLPHLPESVRRALAVRAARGGQTLEEEALSILADAVRDETPVPNHGSGFGTPAAMASDLMAIGRRCAGLGRQDRRDHGSLLYDRHGLPV